MSGTISMIQAFQITGICMGIVFLLLTAISYMIDIIKVVMSLGGGHEASKAVENAANHSRSNVSALSGINGKTPEELVEDEEIAAAIVASIEASGGDRDAKVKIIAVREITGI